MGAPGGDTVTSHIHPLDAARTRTLLAAGAGLVITLSILATPFLSFGVQSAHAHLVLNTLDAFVALVAAYLVYGRFTRYGRLQDLLIVQGLGLLVVGGLGLNTLVDLLDGVRPGALDVWLPLIIRVGGALFIAGAAVVGPQRRVVLRHAFLWPGLIIALGVSLTVVVLWALSPRLPVALDLGVTPESAQHPLLTGHPLLLTGQFVGALCFALAAVLFSRQADECENVLLLWLGPACALGAFARINYVLFPSLYTDWLYTGDLLRTGFYVLLLLGAAREIKQYWAAQADLAVLDDRRRLARELHDGVIQELSFIRSQGSLMAVDPASRQQILSACERGLEEARAAVVALELDDDVVVEPEERHALVRIAREAVTNAVKHGAARKIHVVLGRGPDGRHLVVRDDGLGFDVAEQAALDGAGGYGLVSMRDRAQGLAGRLDIESAPGAGSLVKVTW
jgi:signal transduction histidine kinase